MGPNTILIVGATGRQDSSVLHELSNKLRSPSPSSSTPAPVQPKPRILALTRNAKPPKAQALAAAHPALDLHGIEGYAQDRTPSSPRTRTSTPSSRTRSRRTSAPRRYP
ncbi:hypothetical protein DL771_008013 [Monosporascus sp. 5C6A]|nr:hypothetical protein DL771_008013 [Monosporascus sp. 5C6A]